LATERGEVIMAKALNGAQNLRTNVEFIEKRIVVGPAYDQGNLNVV
jgi:hypothetical protein